MNEVIEVLQVYVNQYDKILNENKFDDPKEWHVFHKRLESFRNAIKILKESSGEALTLEANEDKKKTCLHRSASLDKDGYYNCPRCGERWQ